MPRRKATATPTAPPARRKSYLGLTVANALASILQKPDKYGNHTTQSVVHFATVGDDLHVCTIENTGGNYVVPVFRAAGEALAGAPETFAVSGAAFKAALGTAKVLDFSGIEFAWDAASEALVIEASDGCYRFELRPIKVPPLKIQEHLTVLGEIMAHETDGPAPTVLAPQILERLGALARKSAIYNVGAVSIFSMPGKPYGIALMGSCPGLAVLLSVAAPAAIAKPTQMLLEGPLQDGLIARASQARMYRERAAAIIGDNPELAATLIAEAERREQWLERQAKLFGLPALPAPTIEVAPEPEPEAVDETAEEEDEAVAEEPAATVALRRARKARQRRLH